jgi:hypothetical protein
MLQNRYPQCLLTANNMLQINLIITTFGGYKDYYNKNTPEINFNVLEEQESLPLNLYLLYKTISTTQETAKSNLSSILSGNTELYKEEIPISTYTDALTGFINTISGRIFYSFKYFNWRY